MTVDLWVPYMLMLQLVLMTLTLMQGHSGSAKVKNQRCMLSATKQAILAVKPFSLNAETVDISADSFCGTIIMNVSEE